MMGCLLRHLVDSLQAITEVGITDWKKTTTLVDEIESTIKIAPQKMDTKLHLHGRALLSEWYDYHGRYDKAHSLLGPYPTSQYEQVRRSHPRLYPRLLLQRSRAAHRAGAFEQAMRWVDDSVKGYKEQYVHFGLGMALFWKAVIYFRMRDPENAAKYAYEASDIFLKRTANSNYRVGICKVFLSRVWYRFKNDLNGTLYLLNEAEALLGGTEDFTYRARIADMRGRIARARAKTPEHYQQAEESFLQALSLYTRADNHIGMAMVQNNLGYLYTRIGAYDQAAATLHAAREIDHQEMRVTQVTAHRCGQLYLQWGETSRDLPKLREAASHARTAIRYAGKIHAPSLQASAMLVLAHSIMLTQRLNGNISGDEENFTQLARDVFKLNRNINKQIINKETEASCNLLMAMSHCWEASPDRKVAEVYYDKAKEIVSNLENEFLEQLYLKVENELSKISNDFHISHTCPDLNMPKHELRLQFFLLCAALQRSGLNKRGNIDREQVAALLGKTRQAVENIVKDLLQNAKGKADILGIDPLLIRKALASWLHENNE